MRPPELSVGLLRFNNESVQFYLTEKPVVIESNVLKYGHGTSTREDGSMTIHAGGGFFAGKPLGGGVVSLSPAGGADVIQATAGLFREVATVGLGVAKVGVLGVLMLHLLRDLGKKEAFTLADTRKPYVRVEEQIKQAFGGRWTNGLFRTRDRLDWFNGFPRERSYTTTNPTKDPQQHQRELEMLQQNIEQRSFLPLSGFCVITLDTGRVLGVCLWENFPFLSGKHQQTALLHNMIAFERSDADDTEALGLILRDGSIFEDVTFKKPVPFATLGGVLEVSAGELHRIRGINRDEAADLKQHLMRGLQETPRELLEDIGVDLVSRYFHVRPAGTPVGQPMSDNTSRQIDLTIVDLKHGDIIHHKVISPDRCYEFCLHDAVSVVVTVRASEVLLEGVGTRCKIIPPFPETPLTGQEDAKESYKSCRWTGNTGHGAARIGDRYILTFGWR